MQERLSIVVLTYNRKQELQGTLERLRLLEARYPVYVVDNGSTDGTAAMVAERFPRIHLVRLDENLGAAGRNHGVAQVTTPYVAFCDDDTWWENGSLATAVRILDDFPVLAVVTARILVGSDLREDPTSRLMGACPLLASDDWPGTEVIGFMAGASVMRREAFVSAGGYEQRFFIGGEETLLAYDMQALGWRLAYIPAMVLHHHPSPTRDSALRRKLLLRNALWCAWLRRPLARALRETGRQLLLTLREPGLIRAVLDALAEAGWVRRERRVLPKEVEARLRCVERFER